MWGFQVTVVYAGNIPQDGGQQTPNSKVGTRVRLGVSRYTATPAGDYRHRRAWIALAQYVVTPLRAIPSRVSSITRSTTARSA